MVYSWYCILGIIFMNKTAFWASPSYGDFSSCLCLPDGLMSRTPNPHELKMLAFSSWVPYLYLQLFLDYCKVHSDLSLWLSYLSFLLTYEIFFFFSCFFLPSLPLFLLPSLLLSSLTIICWHASVIVYPAFVCLWWKECPHKHQLMLPQA